MKKILSLALALALCLGLAAPALADVNAAGGWTFEPVGESLDQPAPLPAHLAEGVDPDWWLLYDFDHSKVLEITRDEWGDRTYVMLEGAQFTIWQNPDWQGRVAQVDLLDYDDTFDTTIYRTEYLDNVMEMRSMAPVTVTFDHAYTLPDGTVVDLAKLGATYALRLEACPVDEYGATNILMENFQVIPAVAYASTQTVEIDGKAVEFQMYAIKDAGGNDTNYVKVRDVALALDGTAAQFNVGWDGNVNLEPGRPYTARNGQENNTPYSGNQPFTCATSATNVNGEAADLTAFVITDAGGNGSTYYKLRDLGAALGFTVDWSAERGIYVETPEPTPKPTPMVTPKPTAKPFTKPNVQEPEQPGSVAQSHQLPETFVPTKDIPDDWHDPMDDLPILSAESVYGYDGREHDISEITVEGFTVDMLDDSSFADDWAAQHGFSW